MKLQDNTLTSPDVLGGEINTFARAMKLAGAPMAAALALGLTGYVHSPTPQQAGSVIGRMLGGKREQVVGTACRQADGSCRTRN